MIAKSSSARVQSPSWLQLAEANGPDALVFPTRSWRRRRNGWTAAGDGSRAYTASILSHTIRAAAKRAGVVLTSYQCRHAAKRRITRLLGLDHARAALGQASVSTTDRYAAGVDMELAREAARKTG